LFDNFAILGCVNKTVAFLLQCAFGFKQVIALRETAALWSPKVLRAGMGAHFGLSLFEAVAVDALNSLQIPLVVTSSHSGARIQDARLPFPCAWVLGHEGQGVSPTLLARAALQVRINEEDAREFSEGVRWSLGQTVHVPASALPPALRAAAAAAGEVVAGQWVRTYKRLYAALIPGKHLLVNRFVEVRHVRTRSSREPRCCTGRYLPPSEATTPPPHPHNGK
jgi:hypothetical protein